MVKHTPAPVGGRRKTAKTMKKGGRKSRRVASKKTRKGVKKGRSRRGGADKEKMAKAIEVVKAYRAYNELFNDRFREERGLPFDKGADAEKTKAKIDVLMQKEEAAKAAYDKIWNETPDDVLALFDDAEIEYNKQLAEEDEAAAEEEGYDSADAAQEAMEREYEESDLGSRFGGRRRSRK